MNTNLIALRRKEHFESLNLEIQKELDNFYDTKAATHQLKVIKKSKSIPKVGDVFLVSPREGIYFYGKVLVSNIVRKVPDSFVEGKHVVFIFKGNTHEKNIDKYMPDYSNLLIPLKGNFFCKETGELLDKEPRILGMHGITTISGIGLEIERELIINPSLLEENTRTSQSLTVAGVPRNQWHVPDNTSSSLHEKLLDEQLLRNKLNSEGISTVRRSGGTNNGKQNDIHSSNVFFTFV